MRVALEIAKDRLGGNSSPPTRRRRFARRGITAATHRHSAAYRSMASVQASLVCGSTQAAWSCRQAHNSKPTSHAVRLAAVAVRHAPPAPDRAVLRPVAIAWLPGMCRFIRGVLHGLAPAFP